MNDDRYQHLFELGKDLRAQSMGPWVEQSATQAEHSDFGVDFQRIVTALVWGGVWSRPGLGLRERSLIAMTVLITTGKVGELRKHIPNALRNGATKKEIDEMLIQIAAYAGFPTAVGAYAVAQEVFDRLEAEDSEAAEQVTPNQ